LNEAAAKVNGALMGFQKALGGFLATGSQTFGRTVPRAIHHDGHTPAAVLRVFHPGEHVLEEQQLAVADPGQLSAEPTGMTTPGLGLDSGLVKFPFLAVRGLAHW